MILDVKLIGNELEAVLQSSSEGTLKASEFLGLFKGLEVDGIRRMRLDKTS